MNHVTQLRNLKKELKSYIDFMPLCPDYNRLKLMREIYKIMMRIDKINDLMVDELVQNVVFYYETKQSKMNFKTI